MRLFAAPTSDEWLFIGIVSVIVIMMITVAELMRRLLGGNSEVTRKFVHISTGILMACSPLVFNSGIPSLAIALAAVVGTSISLRFELLKSLHDTERRSYGTVFHPLAFLILVLIFWDSAPHILSLSILILAIPDALAAIVGQRIVVPHYFPSGREGGDRKTIEGSAVMFLSIFFVILLFLWYTNIETRVLWSLIALTTALFVSAWELLCTRGSDNLTVPFSAAFMFSIYLFPQSHQIPEQLVLAVLFGSVIGVISLYFKFLSPSGSVATFILATIIFGLGGWKWTVPILTFFILSSLLSKIGKSRKKNLELVFDKTDKRDAGQVAANGGVAGMIILLWNVFPAYEDLYLLYVAAIAAAAADTWGTEIGTTFKSAPRSIISFKKVPVGTSGGVSFPGIIGGAAGATAVACSILFTETGEVSSHLIVMIVFSGIVGSLIDSFLGAAVQGQFRTPDGNWTERSTLNGKKNELVHGFSRITNDAVNWLCTLAGAATMYFLL